MTRPSLAIDSAHPGPATDDSVLVARIRAGDERAFEELFFTYYRPLCAYVDGIVKSNGVGEELVQELLMSIWEHREQWHVEGTARAYLFGAARNRALNCARNQQVVDRWEARAVRDTAVSGMGQGPAPVDQRIAQSELHAAFSRATERLPARQREAFSLRWRGQLSHAEIAEIMGVSVKAVEFNLGRAFRALRKELAPYL